LPQGKQDSNEKIGFPAFTGGVGDPGVAMTVVVEMLSFEIFCAKATAPRKAPRKGTSFMAEKWEQRKETAETCYTITSLVFGGRHMVESPRWALPGPVVSGLTRDGVHMVSRMVALPRVRVPHQKTIR
jgi:hypothetical protein